MLAAAPKPPQTIDIVHPLLHALLMLWPIWLLVGAVVAIRLAIELRKIRRLRSAGILDVDRMTGAQFEQFLAGLYRRLGYRAEVVGATRGDYGADLVIARDGTRCVVQAKCWRKKNVGVKAVQEAVAARGYYGTDTALVVTNSHFTGQARKLARANEVDLWDRQKLIRTLLAANKDVESKLADGRTMVLDSAPEAPAIGIAVDAFCARCGKPVSDKVRDFCLSHADRFSGLIYCYDDQRAFPR